MEDSLHKAGYMIVEQNVDVNETDQLGRTPLQIASCFGFYQAAKLLLENGLCG
ncbi:ankyrin repeat domain-containing protein [Oceanobacillus chungangensis]|uniref:ankyrin repeat domain-containing protein n=1 Tax=Oceanobacillus chungangensis TaxID=1229152 RepID=UPI000E20E54F|nr:ankyrin repeat domain-containing protein [Oceanobacillus chungangensis]